MARSILVFFTILVLFSSLVSSSHVRKLLTAQEHKTVVPSLEDRLYLNSLPKGTVTHSSPSKKGNAMVVDEKLNARHLIAIDRILRSVPSPGIGN